MSNNQDFKMSRIESLKQLLTVMLLIFLVNLVKWRRQIATSQKYYREWNRTNTAVETYEKMEELLVKAFVTCKNVIETCLKRTQPHTVGSQDGTRQDRYHFQHQYFWK